MAGRWSTRGAFLFNYGCFARVEGGLSAARRSRALFAVSNRGKKVMKFSNHGVRDRHPCI